MDDDSTLLMTDDHEVIELTSPEEITSRMGGSVTMSRALAESGHGLTLNESRVIMLAMRALDPRKSPHAYRSPDGLMSVKVTAEEFAEIADLRSSDGYTPRAAYEGLRAGTMNLFERKAHWFEGKKEIWMRWCWKASYEHGAGVAQIEFAPDVIRHIMMLNKNFVRYRVEMARGLRSVYSTTLLRLLMTQKDTGFKSILLSDFRSAMEVPKSYKYGDIKRYAITPAVKELNEKADMTIEWSETKRGRAVHSLQFHFTINKAAELEAQMELPLDATFKQLLKQA